MSVAAHTQPNALDPCAADESQSPPPYRVWAPRPAVVELYVEGERLPMVRHEDGWWYAERPMKDGERYGYVLDGHGPLPDPRSMRQPSGVHGLSACVDHRTQQWTDSRWQPPPLGAAVIYELHVGTFTEHGTFEAVIPRLRSLAELGVTHLELMPIVEFPGDRGWGYDGVDLFAPHHGYGTPDDLKRLVDACHSEGLAILLDVVYNHLGPSGNYLAHYGPYFTEKFQTPWGAAVNLDDADSDEVRQFLLDNAIMWLRDYRFDGLRLDAVHALLDTSATHFLEQLSCVVEQLQATTGRHLVLIAESDLNDPRIIRSREAGGFGIDAQWSDDFHHALHSVITGEREGYYSDFGTVGHLACAIERGFVYAGTPSVYRRRTHGRAPDRSPGWRFVVGAQNHDQVGNRAAGERLSQLAAPGDLMIAAALVLTSPFVPLLFQGEEWGASTPFLYFTSHEEPELAAQVSEGRRREFAPFGWDASAIPDPQSPETFDRSRLQWDERRQPAHARLLEWYGALIQLRAREGSLRDGDFRGARVSADDERRWLVVRRGRIVVACNFADDVQALPIGGEGCVLLASVQLPTRWQREIALPAHSVAILDARELRDDDKLK